MNTLTYIFHDCFVYESPRLMIVFDFWKDPCAPAGAFPEFIMRADKSRPTYILVSHHHKDHYSREIFSWAPLFQRIKYILSKDTARYCRHILRPDSIYRGAKPSPGSVAVISPGECYEDAFLKIEAFGSTDIGNSYFVTAGGKTLFHAGDLNAWIWLDESSPEEVEDAHRRFSAIVGEIAERHPSAGFAMFPVDSRIGREYYTGARIFVRRMEVGHFFPMHFGLGDTEELQEKYRRDAARTELYANPERGEYICLQSPYSAFAEPS